MYRVTFYRELCNSAGRVFHSPLCELDIRHARTQRRAEEAAKRRFQRMRHLESWWELSSGFDVVTLDEPQPPDPHPTIQTK